MWFRKLKVVNVGPFADLSLDLTRGSIGVFGRNGRGKSTVLNLLYGLATNDFGRFDGVKSEMVRSTADPKAEAYIQGEIEHNGRVLDITRNFKPTKAKPGTVLVCDGETVTDANKAQAKIYEVLGVDGKMLDLYVFKTQDRIYDFLTSIPSERAKAYATLCRTEVCERLWDMLGDFLNKDKEVNTETVDNSDELTGQVADLEHELVELGLRKEQAAEKLCEDKYREKYERRVRDADRLAHLAEERLAVEGEVSVAEATLKKRKRAMEEAQAACAEVEEKYDKRKSKADDTRAALKAWEAYKAYRRQRKKLNEEKGALGFEGDRNTPPEPVEDADKLEAGKKKLARIEQELEEAQAVVAAFKVTGQTACPTCKTPVAHLKDHLAKMQEKVQTLPAEVARLEAKVEAIEDYQAAARKYEKWKAGYDARVAANAKSLAALQSVEAPDGDADELRQWLDRFETLKKELDAAHAARRGAERDFEKAEDAVKAKKTRLAEIRQKEAEIELDAAKLEKAKRRLAEHLTATNEISSLEGEVKGVRKQIDAKKEELRRLKAKLKRTRKVRQMAKIVEAAREVLHRDRLPRRVAQMNLSRMEGDINDHLKFFGDPYWVEANEELSFVVHKAGEPPQNAGRLSTGQRVILALAFWPAVASLWSAELGMLALDEPTANLDGENRKFLRDALGAMAAKVRGHRQLIMVTHDPDLRAAFDQVIDLGG